MVKTRSSKGYLSAVVSRLSRIRNFVEFRAYRMSDQLVQMLARMDAKDRDTALNVLSQAHVRVVGRIELVPSNVKRVAWNAARITRLKAAEAKYGTDEGIARALGISLESAKRARWRYIGPRAPKTPPSTGVAATAA